MLIYSFHFLLSILKTTKWQVILLFFTCDTHVLGVQMVATMTIIANSNNYIKCYKSENFNVTTWIIKCLTSLKILKIYLYIWEVTEKRWIKHTQTYNRSLLLVIDIGNHWCYGLNWVLPNLYVELLTSNMTVLGDRALKEVIKIKWGQKGRTLIQQD